MTEDIIAFIKSCVRRRKIVWTYHVNMRLRQRAIAREIILSAADSFEIIEYYPDDKYFPSCLVYAEHDKTVFHVLIGIDREGDTIRIITAYRPTPDQWHTDYKTRRQT